MVAYASEAISARLRAAREAKGISQRELGKIAGLPQAQISRIEAGQVDMRLSTLSELSHALDLEIALVPRNAVPAIRSITQQLSRHDPLDAANIKEAVLRMYKAGQTTNAIAVAFGINPGRVSEIVRSDGAITERTGAVYTLDDEDDG